MKTTATNKEASNDRMHRVKEMIKNYKLFEFHFVNGSVLKARNLDEFKRFLNIINVSGVDRIKRF